MYRFITVVIFIGVTLISFTQEASNASYRLMFYNIENLFDTIDNPITHDEEFLPNSDKHWGNYRYWKKINKTFQVIAAAGRNEPPDIIGFCEVEDFLPLYHITNNTPLVKFPYQIVHQNSPDRRGIDVGLVYRSDKIKLIDKNFHRVVFPWDTAAKTREILHASLLLQDDTLHVFVNHWPSRRGGEVKSEPRRVEAAKVLMAAIDSIRSLNEEAKIVVMGDFNDEPHNKSIQLVKNEKGFVNLSEELQTSCKCGSYKFRSEWNMIDQVLISNSLLREERLTVSKNGLRIVDNAFLLELDKTYGGSKPYRTYLGPRYIGGYSDHLPVVLDLDYF